MNVYGISVRLKKKGKVMTIRENIIRRAAMLNVSRHKQLDEMFMAAPEEWKNGEINNLFPYHFDSGYKHLRYGKEKTIKKERNDPFL